jgi:hypothetical protein
MLNPFILICLSQRRPILQTGGSGSYSVGAEIRSRDGFWLSLLQSGLKKYMDHPMFIHFYITEEQYIPYIAECSHLFRSNGTTKAVAPWWNCLTKNGSGNLTVIFQSVYTYRNIFVWFEAYKSASNVDTLIFQLEDDIASTYKCNPIKSSGNLLPDLRSWRTGRVCWYFKKERVGGLRGRTAGEWSI